MKGWGEGWGVGDYELFLEVSNKYIPMLEHLSFKLLTRAYIMVIILLFQLKRVLNQSTTT